MLSKQHLYKIGYFDSANRYHLYSDWATQTSIRIRMPSRAYPLSVWRHAMTNKYFLSLSPDQLSKLGLLDVAISDCKRRLDATSINNSRRYAALISRHADLCNAAQK